MFQQSGKMELFGSMSYVPNEPWILSATVRDNIVFGSKFDLERYRQVVKVCALNRDFRNLVNGDRTEIGERGINLTLGQRHRISLARAAYSNTDIIFIDESLSVMDSRVSKHIFKEVLQEFLQDRAIVFVTNQLQYLPKCNHIIVMKSGKIIEQGSYEELMANDVDLAALVGESVEIEDPNKIDDLALDDEFLYNPVSETNTHPTLNINEQSESGSESGNQNIKIVINNVPDRPRASFIENDQNSVNPTVTFSRTNTIERSSAQNNQASNDLTISRMIERVNHLPSEQAVSTIIDRHQLSVLGGAGLAMNINNTQAENNALARALERNQMTIHSIQVHEGFEDSSEEPIDKSKLLKTLYLAFFKEGTGVWITSICFVFFFIVHIFRLYNDYWLEVVSNSESTAIDVNGYLNVYSYIGIAFIVGVVLRGLFFTAVMVKKGLSFHKNMLEPILSAPISYFEYTPLSKILTSFARHLTLVDEHMFDSIFLALQFFPLVIGTFLLCVIVVPFLAIPGVILLSICLFLIWYVKIAEDKIQSSEVNSRSPMFSHLAATLEGLQSIRVYRIQARFDAFNLIKIDASNKALYALTLVKCWLALYIDIVASVLIYLSVLLVLIQEPNNISLTEGLVGLALSNAMQILLFGQITVQAIQDSMGSIWSIDQLIHFRTSITPEGQQDSNDYEPPTDWPTQGRISFQNVMLRYHRYGVAVLKNVSFTIEGKEKVAIVGTTGSGKTTLLTSLLRLVEAGEGNISIDDVDISSISLEALRRSIAVIPQDPVLFYGTVRSNLDPYSHCSEEEMWNALKSVHLSEKVKDMPLQLDTPIVENGTIFTFAQRQLFCIARAILLKCKILILDEATSAVDLHTEHMIQETIDNNFQNYTVLFVGHRLNSIIEADKILVMDQGQVVEYDPPDVLLSNPDGHFYSMVLQNGEDVVQSLHSQAVAKAEAKFKRRQSDNLERHISVDRNTVSDSHQITLKTLASQISHSQSTHSSVKIKDMPRSLEGVFQNLATTSSHSLNNQDESPTSSSTPLANSKKSSTDITKH
jgi:ABC-type multidrug transport system fused ATPase/permease subunit